MTTANYTQKAFSTDHIKISSIKISTVSSQIKTASVLRALRPHLPELQGLLWDLKKTKFEIL